MRWKPYATASKVIANVGLEGLMSLHDELESLPKFFIPTIDKFATVVTLTTLGIYKQYIDPHKHGKCSHRLVHGGLSCSDYIRGVVKEHGAIAATPFIKQRYADCRESYFLLKIGRLSPPPLRSNGDLHCHLDLHPH
jgi:putative component of membrane protein insertase Oxa1/YidC/SpoIIIJ protein YidD